MSDATLRRLLAIAAVFVIAASGVFVITKGVDLYDSYQNEQSASLDRAIQKSENLTRELIRRSGR